MNTWPDSLQVKTAIPPRHGEHAVHEGEVLGLTLAAHLLGTERNIITYGTIRLHSN